jgi:hypothetical protein
MGIRETVRNGFNWLKMGSSGMLFEHESKPSTYLNMENRNLFAIYSII